MKEIKEFIENYIEAEFKANKGKYDIQISDLQYNELERDAYSFYHSINPNSFGRGGSINNIIGDETWINRYKKKYEKIIPRTLFQIKQYKSSKIGEGLERWLVSDELFACYTSYTENTDSPLDYSTVFYVAQTNEGLKIVYKIRYESDVPEWRHSHDLKINQVKNPGQLVAVEKYHAPDEANSLADYNAE
ncbi:hypothetical protein MQX03_00115 [Chryseobacterium aahli]|uniref:hypothetical protein n=1 Tax=Chryseobacterium aahli TaxID=1278643 RepID=UPI001F613771|nr:hypothetical protein [Chryseobacterium aahli]MCI3935586.1 hypothetical protein [Chryseobacterium aahli]